MTATISPAQQRAAKDHRVNSSDPGEVEVPFSQLLRDATAHAHHNAETAPFVHRLMAGELDAGAYARLLRQLHPVYESLEQATYTDEVRAGFTDPRFARLAALEQDLEHLLGPSWRSEAVLPAAAAYGERVASVSSRTPAYIAHHYTRYLGDLSGGQLVARRMSQHYGLREGEPGLLFYRFDGIDKPKLVKDSYRRALDSAPWDQDERATVIAEAQYAFAMNAAVFASLA